ncbi:hypothetical protein K431DRAFT_312004 [Polychaeton citri CBS 116435]|uniref:Uncharacterized protein n=1 Tax=Polychaeton citri CBS 116435 TaxID=1314669 RepID=A0A9P4UPQ4_9PEZI|nr:hypothetical protein K431DRAFT_312004 [Polychaeton citri CBS 116435]
MSFMVLSKTSLSVRYARGIMSPLDALTENISLLKILDPKLSEIRRNALEDTIQDTNVRFNQQISPSCERATAEAFAVFLATSEDPNRVGAVCVEVVPSELPQMVVRVAVNDLKTAGRVNDLQIIASAIAECAISGHDPFDALVQVLQHRLLARFRSKHAPSSLRSSRASPVSRLNSLCLLSCRLDPEGNAVKHLKLLASSLNHTFASLERLDVSQARGAKGRELLKVMLNTVESLMDIDIGHLFTKIPVHVDNWDEPARNNFLLKLRKLAQYRRAAVYLTRKARTTPMYQNIKVRDVSHPAFRESARPSTIQSKMGGVLSRSLTTGNPRERVIFRERLERYLGKSAQEVQADIAKDARLPKKVHAEMQLLVYYEMQPSTVRRPRFICSSKHACYLCNLFVKKHGSHCVPSTHGTVYSKWKLPDPNDLGLEDQCASRLRTCLNHLNDDIEAAIIGCLKAKRAKSSGPSESIIFHAPSITPSILSMVLEEPTANSTSSGGERSDTSTKTVNATTAPEDGVEKAEGLTFRQEQHMQKITRVDSAMQQSQERHTDNPKRIYGLSLSQDSPQIAILDFGTDCYLNSERIELFIEYEGAAHICKESQQQTSVPKLLRCELFEDTSRERFCNALDAHTLTRDCIIPIADLHDPGGLSLRAGSQVLRLQLVPS